MHPSALEFTQHVREKFPDFFLQRRVLDVGSGDINGNNRGLFQDCEYTGIDVAPGKNVDVVSKMGDFRVGEYAVYDTIVSTECFEHDLDFVRSFRAIVRLLKPGGLFFFTCAAPGRMEHGTLRTSADQSLSSTLSADDGWYGNYYRNLTPEDITRSISYRYFYHMHFQMKPSETDLYFWGVRNAIPYEEPSIVPDALFTLLEPYRYRSGIRCIALGSVKLVDSTVDIALLLRERLPNATKIVCVGDGPNRPHDGIAVEIGDSFDNDFVERVNKTHGPFDVSVSRIHNPYLYDIISVGGLYIVDGGGGRWLVEAK